MIDDKPNSRGIIYVVTGGRNYIGELRASVNSLRKYNPDIPVTVFSSFPIPKLKGVTSCKLDVTENPHKLKVYSMSRSPYEETLFLDTDTQIRGSLDPLFEELGGLDFCAANAHVADYSFRPPRFIAMVKEGGYNTGVLLYRDTEPTRNLLGMWKRDVLAHDSSDMWAGHNGDQYFFNELIQAGVCDDLALRWGTLDNVKWNCRGIAVEAVRSLGRWDDVTILHHRTTEMKIRKLMYSVFAPDVARVIFGKFCRFCKSGFRKTG